MATTIQNIELPKKPRARDTSTSVQAISQELIANGNFATDPGGWTKLGGTISGAKGVLDSAGGLSSAALLQQVLTTGKTYRLVFDVESHNDDITESRVIDLDGTLDIPITGDGTGITVDFTHTGAQSWLMFQARDGSYFKIDNVSLVEIESFPNNNHGEIYSGRGLEFDGVTDYLDIGQTAVSTGAWTVAAWINTSGIQDGTMDHVSDGGTGNRAANYLGVRHDGATPGVMTIYDYATAGFRNANTKLNLNTWYRALWVYDGAGEATMYLNGVADGTGSIATSGINDDLVVHYIGSRSSTSRWWNGMISDYQAWDAAFTADDAAYDFANPESLALNASGTALTEGNLKLWYPMQDGHRGQQSYILDGANTGLGVELVPNGDFATDSDWTTGTGILIEDGVCKFNGNNNANIQKNIGLVTGAVYKTTFTISNYESGELDVNIGGETRQGDYAANGTYEVIEASDSGNSLFFQEKNDAGGFVGHLDNVSCKRINDKHHATTVFYGDEMVTNGTFETNTTGWSNLSGATFARNTSSPITGSGDIHWVGGGSSYTAFKHDAAISVVAGRTYRLEYTYKVVGSGEHVSAKLATSAAADGGLLSGFGTETALTATSNTSVSHTFTSGATDDVYLVFRSGEDDSPEIYVDNISLKEVGTASGWTDADQQLDIAQPALQSYNELLWCTASEGTNAIVEVADNSNLDVDALDFSISCWIYPVTESDYLPIFRKGGAGAEGYSLVVNPSNYIALNLNDGASDSSYTNLTDAIVPSGKWSHVAVTCDRSSSTGIKCYLNGVLQSATANPTGENEDIGNSSGVIFLGWSTSDGDSFSGTGTEFMLFKDSILSSAQVLELYNNGKALDGTTHSLFSTKCTAYYRNNGLSSWSNLATVADSGATSTAAAAGAVSAGGTETLLIPQGVDGSRDAQGFLMNKARNTSSLNLDSIGYEEIGDSDTLDFGTGDFTMECWVKYKYLNSGSSFNSIINLGDGITAGLTASLVTLSTAFRFYIGSDYLASTSTLVTGDWYHVVCTRASNAMRLYINKTVEGGTSTTSTVAVTNALVKSIGRDTGSARYYKEEIDGVLIYSKALSLEEVQRNYKATKGSHRN